MVSESCTLSSSLAGHGLTIRITSAALRYTARRRSRNIQGGTLSEIVESPVRPLQIAETRHLSVSDTASAIDVIS